MKTTSWVSVAIVCAAVAGAGGQNPAPREQPTDEAWLPKPGSDPSLKGKRGELAAAPPSAFPDLVPPVPDKGVEDRDERIAKHNAALAKACPRLYGTVVLKVEPADDTFRKLLKARLHQGTFEFRAFQRGREAMAGPGANLDRHRECLLDLLSAATELWANQPKELIPWLEELLIASKELEESVQLRVFLGTRSPDDSYAVRRLRLKMEAELWKAKNPK